MATARRLVDQIVEALAPAGEVRARAMFGEYGLYLDDRVIALICDNSLFFKDIPAARALMSAPETGAPYPGAKPHLIGDALLDTPEALCAVARALADALPPPKPRKTKAKA